MALFPVAVTQAQATLSEQFRDAGAPAELVAPFGRKRLPEEAEAVDDLVSRLCRAEIESRPVGRYGPVKFFPTLGELVGKKKLANADRERVKGAMAKSVGVGYTFLGAMEDEDTRIPGREPREIWNVWAPGLNSGLIEQTAMPSDMVRELRRAGASIFQTDAVTLGLGRFGKKARLGHVGAYYAQAGAILRALQTHPEPLRADPVNAWSYEDYPP